MQVLWMLRQFSSFCKFDHLRDIGNPCSPPVLSADAEHDQGDDTNNDKSAKSPEKSFRCCVKHNHAIRGVVGHGTVSTGTDLGLAGVISRYTRQSTRRVVGSAPFAKEANFCAGATNDRAR